ncbi:ATP-binding protein [Micromonospora haikouensis]|uniref:ATP-binding protein n=1 Tax=Micromonospora haikouensis TaxID=686309 RepID=UPI003414F814
MPTEPVRDAADLEDPTGQSIAGQPGRNASTLDELPQQRTSEDMSVDVPVAAFVRGGERRSDVVPVSMSLAIIERFSEGLYSSPNKTFEELVSNSYDAGSSKVWVYMPRDLRTSEATIVVVDNGASMDVQGLGDLWKIGESRKRLRRANAGRPPIGKFGIGKLATYVLANELTYLVYKDGVHRAITMDYGQVRGQMNDPHKLSLIVATLTPEEARETLTESLKGAAVDDTPKCIEALFGGSEESWTAAIMARLKEPAHHIQQGRLKWVLSTALPLNPAFTLFYNDDVIDASKAKGEESWTFTVGESDEEELGAKAIRGATPTRITVAGEEHPAIRLPLAGVVWGTARLFREPLERGRSEDRARSHGYFVRVRQRLINLDDPTFDVGVELHHGTFTRFNMVINADDLDSLVASPRESIQDSRELRELKQYLLAVFNRARIKAANQDDNDTMPLLKGQGRISNPPPALSQAPLRRGLRRAASRPGGQRKSLGLREDEVSRADQLARENDDLVENILLEKEEYEGRLVRYDPTRKAAVLNLHHPFINNYINRKGASEPLKLLGLTELLTEAYMLDEDIPPDVVDRVIARRDRFLRDLVKRHPRSALVVARHLRESSNSERELEDAVADALELLGFDVQRLGGTGGTDGIAVARLGRRTGDSESYALTYDAKSSGKEAQDVLTIEENAATRRGRRQQNPPRIQAGTAHTSILRVHRERARERYSLPVEPLYTLLVAPGFQGDGIDSGLINDICKNDGITPVTVSDLARLVELFPLRRVSPLVLKEFFKSRNPTESRNFVDQLEAEAPPSIPPVQQMISLLVKYSERRSPVTVDSLSTSIYEQSDGAIDLTGSEVVAMMRGLAALAPNSIYFDGVMVALNASPENLLKELHETLGDYPERMASTYKSAVPAVSDDPDGQEST